MRGFVNTIARLYLQPCRSTHSVASSNPCASASFIVLNIFPSIRAISMIERARPGLQTEPRDAHFSMYIGVEVPEIM